MNHRYVGVVLIAALSGTFLLGAPCGGQPSSKTFSANSIIIPMDNCYQRRDNTTATETVQCNPYTAAGGKQGHDNGVFEAYGLVYMLIKHGITVYWTISPTKTSFVGTDVTVDSGTTANVVTHWNWTSLSFSSTYFTSGTLGAITYIGGPFIIDGADATTVESLLSTNADFAPWRADKVVDLHQSSIGFTAQQVRPLTGPPPRVAIFNFTNGGSDTTSMTVMHNYVVLAGLDTPGCAGGAAGDCAGGVTSVGGCNTSGFGFNVNTGPGKLYDILCDGDFVPPYATSTLASGYRLLWTPHWDDVFDPNGATGQDHALNGVLNVVADFIDAGNNAVTECQGIQPFEGGNDGCSGGSSPGLPVTRFQTTTGLANNENINAGGALTFSNYPSPNMQIGDFSYSLVSGCLTDWGPTSGGAYKPGITHFITAKQGANAATDVYTMNNLNNDPTKGLVVYLGGHDYSSQTAGTRLVLNSLFNLGIPCVSPNTPCNTGLLGVCATGQLQCTPNGGITCVQTVFPSQEICDGLDNNCNGLIDEGLSEACYSGDAGTENVGTCHAGTSVCSNGVWGPCQGEKLPSPELCNGLDDDCDGYIDNSPTGSPNPLTQGCYDGPPGTLGVGTCDAGVQICTMGAWGACNGEVLPQPETCNGLDTDCDGVADDGCGACQTGQTQPCYDGPPGTEGVGICHGGNQSCVAGGWGPCQGEVLPGNSQCNGLDNNCDGMIDTGPCLVGFQCNNGACVPSFCGGEVGGICPVGYTCTQTMGCVAISCGDAGTQDGGLCSPGYVCELDGGCNNPCSGVQCAIGDTCAAGSCVGAICYVSGCQDGGVCLNGNCVTDPCTGVTCPGGTFCRDGMCIQNCAYQQCDGGTACSIDGFCETVVSCMGSCGTGQVCDGGQCVTDPCAGLSCGMGQVCSGGVCVDDPCNDAKCPFGKCVGGQCVGMVPNSGGGVPNTPYDGGTGPGGGIGVKKGCGCGEAGGFEVLGLLAMAGAFLFRARRTQVPAPARVGLRTRSVGVLGAVISLWLGLSGCGSSTTPNDGGGGVGPGPVVCTGGSTACGQICIDLQTSVGNCGACDVPCLLGYTCEQGRCILPTQNPYVSSVTPTVVNTGSTVTFQFTGARFAAGASVSVSGTGVASIDGTHAFTVATSTTGSLDNLDLTGAPAANMQLRVVNPGKLASNAVSVLILSGDGGMVLQPPMINALSPNAAPSNTTSGISVSGTNFQPSCSIVLSGGSLAQPQMFPAVQIGSNSVYSSQVNLNGVAPGSNYSMSVVTSAGQSNLLPFTVLTAPPSLTSISPTHGQKGSMVSFTVTGTSFDTTSTLQIQSQGGATNSIPTTYVSATSLTAGPLDLTTYAVGNYGVFVQNSGAVDSNTVGFVVDSNDPTLVSVSPGSGQQDGTASVTLTGSGFQPNATVTLSSPSGLISPQTPTATITVASATTITITGWNLHSPLLPVGSYNIVVTNPGSNPSGAVTFVVLQGTPIISTISPLTASVSGGVVNGVVTGQYLYSTSVVYVDAGAQGEQPLPTTFDGGSLYVSQDPTGMTPGTYAITVVNPGPLTSNIKYFNLTP